jgi:hypothetical protein
MNVNLLLSGIKERNTKRVFIWFMYHRCEIKRSIWSLWVINALFVINGVETLLVVWFAKLVGSLLYSADLEDDLESDSSFLSEVILDVGETRKLCFVYEVLTVTILFLDLVLDNVSILYIQPSYLYFFHVFYLEIWESLQLSNQSPFSTRKSLHWFNLFIEEVNGRVFA